MIGTPKGVDPEDPSFVPEGLRRDLKHFREWAKPVTDYILGKYLYQASDRDLEDCLRNPSAPQIEKIVVRLIINMRKSGNVRDFDLLLNRIVGKVTEKVRIEKPRPVIYTLSDGRQIVMDTESDDELNG